MADWDGFKVLSLPGDDESLPAPRRDRRSSAEAGIARLADLTPEERQADRDFNQTPANLAMLDEGIRTERDPKARTILENERRQLQTERGAPRANDPWAGFKVVSQPKGSDLSPDSLNKGASGDYLDAIGKGFSDLGTSLQAAKWMATGGDAKGVAQSIAAQINDNRASAGEQEIQSAVKGVNDAQGAWDTAKSIGNLLWSFASNPYDAGKMTVQQLPNALPSLVTGGGGALAGAKAGGLIGGVSGANVGAIGGGLAGLGAGSGVVEFGAKLTDKVQEALQAKNLPATPENIEALLNDPVFRDDARTEGIAKGVTVGAIDALSAVVGGRIATAPFRAAAKKALAREGVDLADAAAVNAALKSAPTQAAIKAEMAAISTGRKVGMGAAGVAADSTLESTGEYAGEYAATGQGKLGDAILEGITSLGQSTAEVAGSAALQRGRGMIGGTTSDVTPAEQRKQAVQDIATAPTVDAAIEAFSRATAPADPVEFDRLGALGLINAPAATAPEQVGPQYPLGDPNAIPYDYSIRQNRFAALPAPESPTNSGVLINDSNPELTRPEQFGDRETRINATQRAREEDADGLGVRDIVQTPEGPRRRARVTLDEAGNILDAPDGDRQFLSLVRREARPHAAAAIEAHSINPTLTEAVLAAPNMGPKAERTVFEAIINGNPADQQTRTLLERYGVPGRLADSNGQGAQPVNPAAPGQQPAGDRGSERGNAEAGIPAGIPGTGAAAAVDNRDQGVGPAAQARAAEEVQAAADRAAKAKDEAERQVRDRNGNMLGTVMEPYDGTIEGARKAAEAATKRMYDEFPDAGNVASQLISDTKLPELRDAVQAEITRREELRAASQSPEARLKRAQDKSRKGVWRAIVAAGGISEKEAADLNIDPRSLGGYRMSGLITKNGMRSDILAEFLFNEGYLSESDMQDGGDGAARQFVQDMLAGEFVGNAEQSNEYHALLSESHDEAAIEASGFDDAPIEVQAEVADFDVDFGGKSNVTEDEFLAALGADEQEIEDARKSRSGEGSGEVAADQGRTRQTGRDEPAGPQDRAAPGRGEVSQEPAFALDSQTSEDLAAQARAAEEVQAAADRAAKAKDEAERQERVRKEIAARSVAAAGEFQLGQTQAEAEATPAGQGDIFSQPAAKPEKPKGDTDASLDRSRPREFMAFSKPYEGATGAKLVGYEWAQRKEEYVDRRGENRTRRVSDWERAVKNLQTGRDVVHQFHITTKDGESHVVSAETAADMLGVAQSTVRTNAVRLLQQEIDARKKGETDAARVAELDAMESFATPAAAIESRKPDGYIARVVDRALSEGKTWGSADGDAPGREKYRFLKRDGKFIFSPELVTDGSVLHAAGWRTVELRANEIWNKEGEDKTSAFRKMVDEQKADRVRLEAKLERLFLRDGGVKATRNASKTGQYILLTAGTTEAPYRVTSIDDEGPSGHRDYNSIAEAANEFAHSVTIVDGPAPKVAKPVTPQVASAGMLKTFIGIAADSIEQLRKVDVERVLTSNPKIYQAAIAQHIKDKRPDLADEVDAVLEEAAPAQEPAEPKAEFDSRKERALQDEIRGLEKSIDRQEAAYTKQGSMVPPPIRQAKRDAIERLRDQLDAKKAELAAMYEGAEPKAESVSRETIADAIKTAKNGDDLVNWLAANSANKSYRAIAKRIRLFVRKPEIVVVTNGVDVPGGVPRVLSISHAVFYEKFNTGRRAIFFKDESFEENGLSEETALHELIHAATMERLRAGNLVRNRGTELFAAVQDLYKLQNEVVKELDRRLKAGTATEFEQKLSTQMSASEVKELMAWGLTDVDFQNMLRSIKVQNQTGWSKFVAAVRKLLGLTADSDTALGELLTVTDRILEADLPKGSTTNAISEESAMASRSMRAGSVETVGDYTIRTFKDGAIFVKGDAAEIRALLPEGIVGRPAEGGLIFSHTAAHRVQSAIEGQNLAYSRGGKVLGKKGDIYVAFEPTQIKSAIGNNGNFDPNEPSIMASRPGTIGATWDMLQSAKTPAQARALAMNLFDNPNKFNLWDKTIGTQLTKARKNEYFRAVFDALQAQQDSTAAYAIEAEAEAADVLARMEGMGEIKSALKSTFTGLKFEKGSILPQGERARDLQAVSKAIFSNIEGEQGVKQKVFTDAELAKDFGLNDRQIALYRQSRAAIDRSLDRYAQSLAVRMAQKFVYTGDLHRAGLDDTVEALTERMRLKRQVLEGQKEPEQSVEDMEARLEELKELRQAMPREILRSLQVGPDGETRQEFVGVPDTAAATALEKEIRDVRRSIERGASKENAELDAKIEALDAALSKLPEIAEQANSLKDKGYAPAMRFGDYAVTATQGGETVFFTMVDTKTQANLLKMRLAREMPGAELRVNPVDRESFKLFGGVDPATVELFARFMEVEENDAFKAYIALATSSRSALKHMLERKGIAGFSDNLPRVMAAFITSNSRAAARNIHGFDVNAATEATQKNARGDVSEEAAKLVNYMNNPTGDFAKVRGFMFAYFMGGSVSSALVNLTQPLMMTTPYLEQFAGKKIAGIMVRASKAAATGKVEGPMKAALARAEAEGITDAHEYHQLMQEAEGGGLVATRALMKSWGSMFGAAERFNRRITFLAAFETGQGMTREELSKQGVGDAYEFAKQAVVETQGLYNRANRPNWARNPVGALAMTFKQFSIAWIEFFIRLPRKQQLMALGLLILMAGIEGLPFAEDLEDLIDTIGQRMGRGTNSKKALRQAATNILGETGAQFALHGISGLAGMPMDVAGRLGMGNLIPGTKLLNPSIKDKGREVLEIVGPAGGLAQKGAGILDGNVKEAMPKAFADAAKAWEMLQTGEYRDTRGRKVMDVDGMDSLMKMIGFQPRDVAANTRFIGENMRDVDTVKRVESEIAEQWADGIRNKDVEESRAARERLQRWNAENPDLPIKITFAQVLRRARQASLTRDERFMKTAPPELRRRMLAEAVQ